MLCKRKGKDLVLKLYCKIGKPLLGFGQGRGLFSVHKGENKFNK